MNQNQGISSYCSPDLPMKRKRGRPRKDENVVHGESMPAQLVPDNQKKNKMGADGGEDEMLGRVVSGVIEGSFDAGYLLNVKVEDTDTQLRGVVFLPGKFTPVTEANDVAPNVKMCKRTELPIPALNVQSEQSDKHPVEVKQQLPEVLDQTPPRIPQSGIAEPLRSLYFPGFPESSSFVIPHIGNFPKSVTPTVDGKTIQQKALGSSHDQQSIHAPTKSDNDKVDEQEKMLSEAEQPATITEPTGAEGDESKTEKATEPTGGLPSIETVIKDPPVQRQHDVKSLDVELNHTPFLATEHAPAMATIPSAETVCKALQAVATEKGQLPNVEVKSANNEFAKTAPVSNISGAETVCKDAQILPDDVVSEKCALAQDVNSEKSASIQDAVKNVDFEIKQTTLPAEPAFAASKPAEKNPTEEEAAPKLSPVLKEETVASLGSIPSDTMECDTVDAIPTAQS